MSNDVGNVRIALARAVAQRKIADEVIDATAKRLATAKHPIRGINVCELGICIDYIIDGREWWTTLPELVQIEGGWLKGIEIFPWGIINPDILHVRVAQEFDEMPPVRG
jgi:hypothetical protein